MIPSRSFPLFLLIQVCWLLFACAPRSTAQLSSAHLSRDNISASSRHPASHAQKLPVAPAATQPPAETFTVVVNNVPARELLFSMARDAHINLDIHNDIQGKVTLNAVDQTLQQILQRISRQLDIRYSLEKNTLRVRADTPYLQSYKIDYVNISRESEGIIRVATNLGSTGQGTIGNNSTTTGSNNNQDNSSLTRVTLTSNNTFWDSLTYNIIEILGQSSHADASAMDNSDDVIVNRESGLIMIRATAKQHRKLRKFIDQVLTNSRRQVLIEATIAEIKLSDRYQAGIDWSLLAERGQSGLNMLTDLRAANLAQPPFSALSLDNSSNGNQVSLTLRALQEFGDVKVLSSPKVMAINNQPAILKVVDNVVYFEMDVDTSISDRQTLTSFQTQIKTVPVGFVMSVTPYINEDEVVTLNIRPTISRVIDSVEDPNPAFKEAGVISAVPVIQVREIESILSINSGDTAIIGGLMQDTINDTQTGVPFLSSLPLIGWLFRYDDDYREKSELVIFIRPIVVHQASLASDLSRFRDFLPATESSHQP